MEPKSEVQMAANGSPDTKDDIGDAVANGGGGDSTGDVATPPAASTQPNKDYQAEMRSLMAQSGDVSIKQEEAQASPHPGIPDIWYC